MAYTEAQARAIIADMLRHGEEELGELLEMRRSPLSDLAAILADAVHGTLTADALRSLTADAPLLSGEEYALSRDAADSYRPLLTAALKALSGFDRASLAGALTAHLTSRGQPPHPDVLLSCRRLPGRCAYLRNPLSDEAYDLLQAELERPTALYVGDMEEACESVTSGEADYCILPVTASDGSRAGSVLAMARTHRLTACAVCRFFDGEDVPVRYALFGSAPRGGVSGVPVLSVSFPELTDTGLAAHLTAAASLGAEIRRASQSDGRGEVTLRGGDVAVYLVYLCLFAPDFRVNGYYSEERGECS